MAGRFQPDHSDERCTGGNVQRLQARAQDRLMIAKDQRPGKECHAGLMRVDEIQVLRAFPSPQDDAREAGQRIASASGERYKEAKPEDGASARHH
jgi:hypothetical protein